MHAPELSRFKLVIIIFYYYLKKTSHILLLFMFLQIACQYELLYL